MMDVPRIKAPAKNKRFCNVKLSGEKASLDIQVAASTIAIATPMRNIDRTTGHSDFETTVRFKARRAAATCNKIKATPAANAPELANGPTATDNKDG